MESLVSKLNQAINLMQEIKKEIEGIQEPDQLYNEKGQRLIDKSQQEEIRYLTRDYPDVFNNMMGYLGLQKLGDMPRKDYRRHIERLRAVIETKIEINKPKVDE